MHFFFFDQIKKDSFEVYPPQGLGYSLEGDHSPSGPAPSYKGVEVGSTSDPTNNPPKPNKNGKIGIIIKILLAQYPIPALMPAVGAVVLLPACLTGKFGSKQ